VAVAEADLDAFVERTCQRADPHSGITPHSYPSDVWAQLHAAEEQRKAAEWTKSVAGQKIDRLEREVAQLRRELARLRVSIIGGTVKQARAAGYRAPAGAPASAPVAGLRELLVNARGDALGTVRAELEERLTALEQRPLDAIDFDVAFDSASRELAIRSGSARKTVKLAIPLWRGIYAQDRKYDLHDVCSLSGSMWIAVVDGTSEKPSLESAQWRLCCKRGSSARDLTK
jgi:hypothetical protein